MSGAAADGNRQAAGRIERGINHLTELSGRALAWLLPCMVLLTLAVVVLRYLFDLGSIALQESVLYMHGACLLLGLAYTLKHDAHVRVDVLAGRLAPRARLGIELLGHLLFLLPLCTAIVWFCSDYVAASWRVREGSPEVGGIPGIYLLKSLLLLAAVLLALQALAEVLRVVRALRGGADMAGDG